MKEKDNIMRKEKRILKFQVRSLQRVGGTKSSLSDRQADRLTDRQSDRQSNRQTNGQTDRDRQTH